MKRPTLFKAIGKPFKRQNVTLVAVKRPINIQPFEGCSGCFFCDHCYNRLACSKFDRKDGISVWFQEVKNTNK